MIDQLLTNLERAAVGAEMARQAGSSEYSEYWLPRLDDDRKALRRLLADCDDDLAKARAIVAELAVPRG